MDLFSPPHMAFVKNYFYEIAMDWLCCGGDGWLVGLRHQARILVDGFMWI
ncbi:hypothetical protein ACSF6V_09940 [Escherichia coli]